MNLLQRKPNRLKGYDYSRNGVYFITACVKDRHYLLWKEGIAVAEPYELSDIGNIVDGAISGISEHYMGVFVDTYVIMPDHIHLLLVLQAQDGRAMRAPTVSQIVCQMKGYVTKQIGDSIWQKLFYDHIIRNDQQYQSIREYIESNPVKWRDDSCL
jgi:REP element-mobilizing transposase RayT